MTDLQWDAILNSRKEFDGTFYYAVKTTGCVCRPSCPSKKCKRENAIVFSTLEEAVAAGFVPCKRCCPERKDWNGPKEELTGKAMHFIQQHYAEKLTLSSIAKELFVNEHYLLRTFKEKTGYTILEYQNKVRCEESKKLLANPQLKINFISDTVGYSANAHYSRVFRKFEGCTPFEYRKKIYMQKQIQNLRGE